MNICLRLIIHHEHFSYGDSLGRNAYLPWTNSGAGSTTRDF